VVPEPEGSPPYSQEPVTGPYPEPTESTPHPANASKTQSGTIHPCLFLPSGIFPSGFPTKTLDNFNFALHRNVIIFSLGTCRRRDSPDSSHYDTEWTTGVRLPTGHNFPLRYCVHTDCGADPASSLMCGLPQFHPQGKATTHFCLQTRIKMRGAISPLCHTSAYHRRQLHHHTTCRPICVCAYVNE
jgi:hypothetical protein